MLNYILYRIGQFIALHVPRKTAYRIAIFISDLHYIFAFADRRWVKENLKVVFPEKNNRQIHRIRLAMFRNFAKHLVDFFWFCKIDKEFIQKNIKLENLHYFDEALAKGNGVIGLTAHLGSWELGGVLMGVLGYPIWVVALEHKEKKVNDFFNLQRESKGLKVIPLSRAGVKCLSVLRKKGILGLVGDRDFAETGIIVNFFGRPAIFPKGPAAFALKLRTLIVPVFILRNQDDTFTFKVEKPIEAAATGNEERDLKNAIREYRLIFEDYIRKYPDQWYMFRRFWVEKSLCGYSDL